MNKVYSIQSLRGLAALLVLFHHIVQQFYGLSETNWIGDLFANYGHYGVDIFFIISGFIMSYTVLLKPRGFKSFTINRLIRIIPAYYFFTILILLLGIVFPSVHSSNATILTVLKSLLFIPHENPDLKLGIYPTLSVGWTLNLEVFFYFLLGSTLLLHMSNTKRVILTCLILLILPIFYRLSDFQFYKVVAGNIRLYEFIIGLLIGLAFVKLPQAFKGKVGLITTILLLLIGTTVELYSVILNVMLVCASLIIGALCFEQSTHRRSVLLEYLGKVSYSLYLSHSLVIIVFWLLYPSLSSTLEAFFISILILITTLVVSHFSFLFIERKASNILLSKIKLVR